MKFIVVMLLIYFITAFNLLSQDKTDKRKDTVTYQSKEVVISGMRYPETISEVPLSVSLIKKQDMMFTRSVGIEEPLNLVPGVLAQTRSGYTDARITIRGFGARGAGDRSNSGTSRGIKFYLNELPLTEPDGRTSFDEIDFSLADRIEVVRSNASTIWGNAAGGVVSINTMPEFNSDFLSISDMIGSYGLNKMVFQSGTILGESRLNMGFTRTTFDGYRENSKSERYLLNLGLKSPLSNNTDLGITVLGVSNEFNIPGPLTQVQFDSMPDMANPQYLSRKERRFNRLARFGVNLEHTFLENNKLSFMTFLNPKFLQRSERNTFRDFTRYHLGGALNWVNNLIINNDIANIFLLGADEQYQDGAIQFFYLEKGERGKLRTNKREGANTAGLYFQNELIFNNGLTVLFGARYDIVTYYTRVYFDNGKDILINNSEDKDFSHVTPKFGVLYKLSDSHSIFANVGGGIEVPAGNETDPSGIGDDTTSISKLLNPIISTTYEIGDKFMLYLDGNFIKSFSNEVSLYYILTKNELIPYASGAYYLSAGKTGRMGVEWGIALEFTGGFFLKSALTYSINKYIEYNIDSAYAKFNANYKDNEIAGIPSIYYNTALKWIPGFFDDIFLEFQAQGTGDYFADDANKFKVPSFNIFNLKFGLNDGLKIFNGLKLNVFASLNNITNSKYVSSAFINPDLEANTNLPKYLEPGLPMNFILNFGLSWK